MRFLGEIIQILDARMKEPELYGWFHLLCLVLMVAAIVGVCILGRAYSRRQIINFIFGTAIVVTMLEVYKQVNFTFTYEDGKIVADYAWYAFPWQFCSMPMYVGLLVGVFRVGKLHEALCAFLATYSIFAGMCVMLYPATVFTEVIGINIQTMVCHGAMVVVGVYLLYTGYVEIKLKTIAQAMPVFGTGVGIAMLMNEIAYRTELLKTDDFNMFMISPYLESTLPVYSQVQKVVPYPGSLLLYVGGFTVATGGVLVCAMVVRGCMKSRLRGDLRSQAQCYNSHNNNESSRRTYI